MTALPFYEELDQIERIGIRTSWGLLPAGLGTLALQSPAAIVAAAGLVRTGEVVSLSVESAEFNPPLFGRRSVTNEVTETGRNIFEDDIRDFNPQSASQWDGLPHVRAREFGFYSGITDLAEARREQGMQHWARHGIVGRAVLVDVPTHLARTGAPWDAFAGSTIGRDQLAQMLEHDGVALEQGDILLLRFGWLKAYRNLSATGSDRTSVGDRFSGLASDDSMVEFLWNAGLSAIGSDNPAIESAPGDPADGSLHRKLIPGLGFALAELLDLETLATRASAEDRTTFFFVAAPAAITDAVSSTANALAIL